MQKFCSLCGIDSGETTHLSLYVRGSEGIHVCLDCRIALTEHASQMLKLRTRVSFYQKRKEIENAP